MTNVSTRLLLVAILSTLLSTETASPQLKTNASRAPAPININVIDQNTTRPSTTTIPRASAFIASNQSKENLDFREHDEIRKAFQLTPGTLVEVSSIRGSVDIETANIEIAEIHIVRSARRRDDLEQYKISIEHKPQGLIVRGEQSRRTSGPDVRHRVMLRLPRRVDLSVRSVSGQVRIGDVEGQLLVSSVSGSVSAGAVNGQVQVNSVSGGVDVGTVNEQVEIKSVSGHVSIAQAVGFLDVSSVSGTLSAGISKLGLRGVQINSVSGQVELRFIGELNAQLITNSISGKASIEVPNVTMQSSPGASALRAVIGKGGPTISIKNISGGVRLIRG